MINFNILGFWDVKRHFAEEIQSKYEVVTLKQYITQENVLVKPFLEPQKEFKILGVNNKEGLVDAYIEKGENIKQPYQKVEDNSLAYNPYRVNVGSIGLKTELHKHDLISNAYVVFSCKEKLLPNYLYKVFTSDKFNKQIRDFTAGSVRQNLSYDILVELQIPLPSLDIQHALVAAYQDKIAAADKAEQTAKDLEAGIEQYLLEELGIEIKRNDFISNKKLQMVKFSDITRWDIPFILNYFEIKSIYETIKMNDLIQSFMCEDEKKSLRFESFRYPDEYFSYLGMEHIEKQTGLVIEMPTVKGTDIKSQTIKVPKNYFIFGKLRPYLNKYWFNDTENNKIICSSEFLVFSINDKINWSYFLMVLSSKIIQEQINHNTSGVRMPRMNEELFKNLEIPLPPLPTQNAIVSHITAQKAEIKRLRAEAETLRKAAKEDFEKEIFHI